MEEEASDSLAFIVQQRVPQSLVSSQLVSESKTRERIECTTNDIEPVLSFV